MSRKHCVFCGWCVLLGIFLIHSYQEYNGPEIYQATYDDQGERNMTYGQYRCDGAMQHYELDAGGTIKLKGDGVMGLRL